MNGPDASAWSRSWSRDVALTLALDPGPGFSLTPTLALPWPRPWQALTAAANDTLSGDDEDSEGGGGAKRKIKHRQGSMLPAQDMEDSGNRQCVACGATARSKCPSAAPLCTGACAPP